MTCVNEPHCLLKESGYPCPDACVAFSPPIRTGRPPLSDTTHRILFLAAGNEYQQFRRLCASRGVTVSKALRDLMAYAVNGGM